MKKIIIGIDISSKTLDICLNTEGSSAHFTIANQVKAIHVFFKKLTGQQVVVAMENTGRYNWQLYEALPRYGFEVYVIPALHLKKSLGLVRERMTGLMQNGFASLSKRIRMNVLHGNLHLLTFRK